VSDLALAAIVGDSPAIKRATELVERFAPTTLPILLVGATGTGKELFARHIHHASGRRGELIDVNCGALPHDIAESLLFGHRRGAFTGAVETVSGHLERAHSGTLFLDEVLHLSVSAQVKLLRALETGEVQPLGAGRKQHVDFRVVSAAQEDTPERLDGGTFRHDLFQRLAGVVIDLPLLADRPEDIVPLAEHFAAARGQRLDSGATDVLEGHSWPGNVRELRLAIERAGCLVDNGTLPPAALRDAIALGMPQGKRSDRRTNERRGKGSDRRRRLNPRRSWDDLMARCEAQGWDASRIAESYCIARSTLYEQLKDAGISLRVLRKFGKPEFHRDSTGIPKNRPRFNS
jgi:two-component system nitrogen regulation response regulator NtrX